MSSKVSSGHNHTHAESKRPGQQAPGNTPPAARNGASSGASAQSDASKQSQKGDSGSKQSDSKSDKS